MVKFWYIKDYLEDEGIDPNAPWKDIDWTDINIYLNISSPSKMPKSLDRVLVLHPTYGTISTNAGDENYREWPLSELDGSFFREIIIGIFEG